MSLVFDIVRERIAPDLERAEDLDLVAGLIADRLAPDANLAAIGTAIAEAKKPGELAPVFRKTEAKLVQAEDAPMTGMRSKPRDRSTERVRVGISGGNPWEAGSINLTRQAMVAAADPELADRLRTEAGR